MSQEQRADDEQARPLPSKGRSIAEWTTLGISIGILLLLIGLVIYQHLAHGTRPVAIVVEPRLQEIRQEGEAFYLPVSVVNQGDATAEDVRVQVSVVTPEGQREAAQLNIQFLAGGASARGITVFRHDPRQGSVAVDVISYLEP